MSLPHGGHREDVIRTKAFEDYIRDHVVSWFSWAQKNRLGVERMEELILVSGCTLVTSWGAATSVENAAEAEIALASSVLSNERASFVWSNIRGPVVYHNSRFDPVSSAGYVCSACTDHLFVVSKATPTHNSGSVCLHQGIPSKAHLLPNQTHPSWSRTPS